MTFIRKSLVILTGLAILQSYFVVLSMEEPEEKPVGMKTYFKLSKDRGYELQQYEKETILNLTNCTGAQIELVIELGIPGENGKKATVHLHNNILPINSNIKLLGEDLVEIFNQVTPIKYSDTTPVSLPIEFNDIEVSYHFNSPEVSILQENLIAEKIMITQINGRILKEKDITYFRCDRFFNLPEEENYNIVTLYDKENNVSGFNLTTKKPKPSNS